MAEFNEADNPKQLKEFINKGLDLIREARYLEAMDYYRNGDFSRQMGFVWDISPMSIVIRSSELDEEQIREVASSCARYSYFDKGFRAQNSKPQMTIAQIFPGNGVKLSEKILHSISLIHAEEWLHAMQYVSGTSLTGINDTEQDIALYLHLEGVPLTDDFLSRNNRKEVVK